MEVFESRQDFEYTVFEDTVPLDILLEMCKKGKIDIKDIYISDIVERYMEYVASLSIKDYDDISGFILLASTLLEYKSNALLPKLELNEIPEEIPSEQLFLMRLEEYRILKEAGEKMKDSEILHRFYREPLFGEDDYKLVIKNFDIDKMIKAFTMLMERVEVEEDSALPKTIIKERFTVADRVIELVEILRALKVVNFLMLFEEDFSKIEKINTFLALLEVLKQQVATAEQAESCGDITIRYCPLTDRFDNANEEELLTSVKEYH